MKTFNSENALEPPCIAKGEPARVFYFCYDHQGATGGQKETYQHVDILNRNGIESYVIHYGEGHRLRWFENTTRVISISRYRAMHDAMTDYTVLPEDLDLSSTIFPGRKIIFNKNVYRGLLSLRSRSTPSPYLEKDVVASFCVSEHNAAVLHKTFPNLPILIVSAGIDSSIFRYIPWTEKHRIISFAAKNAAQSAALIGMLEARGKQGLNKWLDYRYVALENLTETRVARILAASTICVFLNVEEGLPLLPLEAMACGCVVAAYDCGALGYLPPAYRTKYGDVVAISETIENVIEAFPACSPLIESTLSEGLQTVARFSVEAQTLGLLRAWKEVFALSDERLGGNPG